MEQGAYHEFSMTARRLLCAALVVLFACGDDGPTEADPAQIPGTWDLEAISSSGAGQTFSIPASEIAADPLVRVFNDDGTGTETYQGSTTSFSWAASNATLTLTVGGSGTLVFTYAANSTTMTLEFNEEESGVTYAITHTFTRR